MASLDRRTSRRRFARATAGLAAVAARLAAGPATTGAEESTPSPATARAFGAMLAQLPAVLPELDDPARVTIAYADIAAQYAALGLARPERVEAGEPLALFWAATRCMLLPPDAAAYIGSWRDDYGFDLFQAEQTLWVGQLLYELALFRGRFDAGVVRRALDAAGYRLVEADGHAMLSVRGDYERDPQAPTVYKWAAKFIAAILGGDTLTFASARAPLTAVLEVAAGQWTALADEPGVAALAAGAPGDLATALLIHGAQLSAALHESPPAREPGATPNAGAVAAEPATVQDMPPVERALLCATAGGPLPAVRGTVPLPPGTPAARAVAVPLFHSPEAAVAAAAVVEARLATGASTRFKRPWANLFPERTARTVSGEPVLVVELTLAEDTPTSVWQQLVVGRDLGYLAW